jgi:hypothetical protein
VEVAASSVVQVIVTPTSLRVPTEIEEITGGVLSTVTVTELEVVELPAASRATAVRV